VKILLVEDEDRSVRQTLETIDIAAPGATVMVVGSKETALAAFGKDGFDLIVCDLRIPPSENSADIDERHGIAVQAAAQHDCPGTPIILLTAFATTRNTRGPLSNGGIASLFGLEHYPMVQLVEKGDSDELESLIRELYNALCDVNSFCSLDAGDMGDEMFLRAARIYAKRIHMSAGTVHTISGGLSKAPLGRVSFSSPDSGHAEIFMKIVPFESAEEETASFQRYVPNRLQTGYFAPSITPIEAGLRGHATLISSLANGCKSLFELLLTDPAKAAETVKTLREVTKPWEHATEPSEVNLAELRMRRLGDEELRELGVTLTDFIESESLAIPMKSRVCHGDLHGENVLVAPDGRPILIDFGDLGPNVAPLDPITLELSIVFHKDGPARTSDWTKSVDWKNWADIDAFAQNSPFESFIRECRDWAMELDTPESVYGTAYAHSVRQFKYPDVDKDIVRGIASSAYTAISIGS